MTRLGDLYTTVRAIIFIPVIFVGLGMIYTLLVRVNADAGLWNLFWIYLLFSVVSAVVGTSIDRQARKEDIKDELIKMRLGKPYGI